MKIYIGADHRGYSLKEELREWLTKVGHTVLDMGAFALEPNDDYTLFAEKVGTLVKDDSHARGILLCGSGVGVDIVANKIDGVRASIGLSKEQVAAGREHDNMNILVLAADFIDQKQAKEMVTSFLDTNFDNESQHKRRLAEITQLEENN